MKIRVQIRTGILRWWNNRLTRISKGDFNLTDINLPERLEIVEGYAFAGCEKLKGLRIPNNLKSIGEGAFDF